MIVFTASLTTATVAQKAEPFKAELRIRADQPKGTINRNIYGNFAEHLGRDIRFENSSGSLSVNSRAPCDKPVTLSGSHGLPINVTRARAGHNRPHHSAR
ncbi:MAG TPA: hypothetical protein VF553_16290 [Pyrinomonadaceae bacterium]|jgi:hypothetical protein